MEHAIDDTDLRLLEELQAQARISNAELARRLEMAPSAIHQRVRRLEEQGVIQGYSTRLEPRSVRRGLLSFVHVRTSEELGDQSVAEALASVPGVLEVHDIAGEDCYLLKVRVADTEALHALLRGRLARIPGVLSTRTTIVLKTIAERVELPLPAVAEQDNP